MRHRFIEKAVDFGLTLLVAVTLAMNLFGAFVIPGSLSLNLPLTIALSALVLLILHITFFSLKSSLISGAAVLAGLVGFGVYANSVNFFSRSQITYQEKDAYYLLILTCAVLTYILAKSQIGVVLLFLAGVFSAFFMGALEYTLYPVCFILFLLGAAVLFIRKTILSPKAGPGKPARGHLLHDTVTALALCSAALILSGVMFSLVSAVFHPKTKPLALLTNYAVLQMAAKTGAASPQQAKQADNYYKKEINPHVQSSVASQTAVSEPASTPGESGRGAHQAKPNTTRPVPAKPVTYFKKIPYALVFGLSAAAVIAALYLLKFFYRRRQMENAEKEDTAKKVLLLYPLYLNMLHKIGFVRKKTQTPAEYARELQKSLHTIRFEPVEFGEMTAIYNKVFYGGMPPDEAENVKMRSFNRSFWKICRQKIGWFRYFIRYLTF